MRLFVSRARKIASQSASATRTLADRVRVFARERENVGQEGFNALVHRVSPPYRSPLPYPKLDDEGGCRLPLTPPGSLPGAVRIAVAKVAPAAS
jgi:hypothetical protein